MAAFDISSYLPTWITGRQQNAKNMNRYISPVQFQRLRQDVQSWRDAISEAELAFYPHRVKMQRIFMDTIQNGHVWACMERRINMTLLKDFGFYTNTDNKDTEVIDEKTTELFKAKWFYTFMRYALEHKFYGYTLISFGDIVDNKFPFLQSIRRENVSPDRCTLSAFIYSISGINFMDPTLTDDNGESFASWSAYIDTPSEKGASSCGYGLLYKVAFCELLLRNLTTQNATYVELFGQPIRWIKTSKTEGDEFDALEEMAKNMGSNAYFISDLQDELQIIETKQASSKANPYENLEQRLQKLVSKIILGHSDALDSVPGKLGSGQDGDKSPVAQALEDIETVDARDFEYVMNDILIPKFIEIGFPVPLGLVFKFKNDKEIAEIRERKDEANKKTADYIKVMFDAGFQVSDKSLKEVNEMFGIDFEKKEPEPIPSLNTGIKEKLKNIYEL